MNVKLKLLKTLKGGIKVWLVDGDLVRQKYYNKFIEGGHDKVYKWMPRKEIWIDDKLPVKNREAVILHEDHERHLMSRGMSYNKAHRSSSIVEGEAKAHHHVAERLKQEETMKNNPRKALAVTLIPRLIPEDEENPKRKEKLLLTRCVDCGKPIHIYVTPEEARQKDMFRCEPCIEKYLTKQYGSKKNKNPDQYGKLTPSELSRMTQYGMYEPPQRGKSSGGGGGGDGWGGLLTLIVMGSIVGVVMYFAHKADQPPETY